MANSLLAHLYSRIRGSQEDVATLALQYLLSQSKLLNMAFTKQIADCFGTELDERLQYTCQSVGENHERPDMAGKNKLGHEVVLCEMKFYAGLTANQPLGYIDRLKAEKGKGLIFICPKARQTVLWSKLCDLCNQRNTEYVKKNCICVDGVYLSILTWADIIGELERVASSFEREYISDIHQLKGYCAQMDSDAFIPFTAGEITADNAKKIQRYYQVVDQTINLICADNISASVVGKASTYFYGNDQIGYERKILIDNFTISIAYDHALWKSNSSVETPFWVSVSNKERKQTDFILERLTQIKSEKKDDATWDKCYLALEPLTDATLDEVCEDLKSQIYQYLSIFRNNEKSE